MDDFQNWSGRTVVDKDGNKIGTLGELYVDDDTGKDDNSVRPKFATVRTGMFGTKESFFPIDLARVEGEEIRLDTSAETVKDAPRIDVDEILAAEEEERLYSHYGVSGHQVSDSDDTVSSDNSDDTTDSNSGDQDAEPSEESKGTVGRDDSSQDTGTAITRTVEEYHFGTPEAGRMRLKKYVVIEQVQTTVPRQETGQDKDREDKSDKNRDAARNDQDTSQ